MPNEPLVRRSPLAPAPRPQLRTSADDIRPLRPDANLPPVEPDLPVE